MKLVNSTSMAEPPSASSKQRDTVQSNHLNLENTLNCFFSRRLSTAIVMYRTTLSISRSFDQSGSWPRNQYSSTSFDADDYWNMLELPVSPAKASLPWWGIS